MLAAQDSQDDGTKSLLPNFDQDQFLFDIAVDALIRDHPILKSADVKRWLEITRHILSAHIAWNGGNHWALDAASRSIPDFPEGLTAEETEEMKGILAELKKEAGYRDIQLPDFELPE